jgi:hypothetical protein
VDREPQIERRGVGSGDYEKERKDANKSNVRGKFQERMGEAVEICVEILSKG